MHSLWQDIRYALRLLARNPGFTAVAILTLALGMGANTAMFTVVNGVLLRPMPFPQPERLFLVSFTPQHGPFVSQPALTDVHYLDFRREQRSFESLATFNNGGAVLNGAGEPIQVPITMVTLDFLKVLRVSPAMGRSFAPDEDQPGRDHVALLSDALWRSRFNADRHLLGKTIRLDGIDRTVIGIMPPDFSFPNQAQVWMPYEVRTNPHLSLMSPVLGRMKPGVSRQQAQVELETFARRLSPLPQEDFHDWRAQLLPLKELLVSRVRESLAIFMGAVGFVLLIGCANVANLLLARAVVRQQELAVRAALGAGRWRLIRQLLAESTLLSLAGGAAGIHARVFDAGAVSAGRRTAAGDPGRVVSTDFLRCEDR